jgi:parvulin-like peptidyl-prolyl isomerase
MKKLIFSIPFSIFLLLGWSNFGLSTPPQKEIRREEVLAKVNGEIVTVGRFYDFLKESRITSYPAQGEEREKKRKEDQLHELIRKILLDQKAISLSLDSDSLFVQRRDEHMQGFLLDYMHQKDIVEKIEVTDQEVKDHYEQYKEERFLIPEKRQVRDLLIRFWADSTQKDYKKKLKKAEKEAKKKIEELYQRATAGEDFAELCRQYSYPVGLDVSGIVGFFERGKNSPEFDSAAFALKEIKEISKPVRDFKGYHLLELLDRKEKSYQELDSALSWGIREYLKNEKINQDTKNFVDSLKNATKFVYNWEVLNSSESTPDKNAWVLAFGEGDTIRYEEYETEVSGYKFNFNIDSVTTDEKKDILINYLALPKVLVKEAEKRGYDKTVEYEAEKRAFTLEEAEKRVLSQRVNKDFPPPTAEEIEAYYQAHKIDFPSLGVPVHVYHIVFNDSLEAVKILNQIKDGADFVEMAKKYFPGESEIKDVAYDLGFISQGEMPDAFYQAALKLKEGEVSEPVKTSWGFHLIKVIEKKDKGTTMADIRVAIERAINQEKARKYMLEWEDNLFKQANVWINQKLFQKLELPKPEG